MAVIRVGKANLDLQPVRGGEVPAEWSMTTESANFSSLSSRERDDLNAFIAAGWKLLPSGELDWQKVQTHNEGGMEAGLLARYPLGGLVILRDRLVVRFRASLDPGQIDGLLAPYSRAWKLGFGENLFEVKLKLPGQDWEEAILREAESLAGSKDVVHATPSMIYHVEPHGRIKSVGLDSFNQWHWEKIKLIDAWKDGRTQGEGKRVAVIDLGFFKDREISNVAWAALLDKEGKVLVDQPLPARSHGTFCAGLVAARNDVVDVNGAAPQCELILVAVSMHETLSQVALGKALELCARGNGGKPGADVISCSLGLAEGNWIREPVLEESINFVLREGRPSGGRNLGTPIVWATFDDDEMILPDSVEGYGPLLSVSQSGPGDFRVDSGFGEALDLLAPGYGVNGISWDGGIRGIGSGDGSSLAAPCVAGVAALVLSVNPDLTWKQVAEVVTQSCDPVGVDPVPNPEVGWGRLNARKAVERAMELKAPTPHPPDPQPPAPPAPPL